MKIIVHYIRLCYFRCLLTYLTPVAVLLLLRDGVVCTRVVLITRRVYGERFIITATVNVPVTPKKRYMCSTLTVYVFVLFIKFYSSTLSAYIYSTCTSITLRIIFKLKLRALIHYVAFAVVCCCIYKNRGLIPTERWIILCTSTFYVYSNRISARIHTNHTFYFIEI